MFRRCAMVLGVLSLIFSGVTLVSAAPSYNVTVVLGDENQEPGFHTSYYFAINATGQVAGCCSTVDADHAFVYSDGTLTDLGALSGYPNSEACAINAAGMVVGDSNDPNGGGLHAFLWNNGTMSDLGTFGGSQTSAGD